MQNTKLPVEERLALLYVKHAEDALEILQSKRYDDVKASDRLRVFLSKYRQLDEVERAFPEYAKTFMALRTQYNEYVEASVHSLVDRTAHTIDAKIAEAIEAVHENIQNTHERYRLAA